MATRIKAAYYRISIVTFSPEGKRLGHPRVIGAMTVPATFGQADAKQRAEDLFPHNLLSRLVVEPVKHPGVVPQLLRMEDDRAREVEEFIADMKAGVL